MIKVLVAIPVYNESEHLKSLLSRICKEVNKADILVVDDGSSDRSFEIVKESGIPIIRHAHNQGKGAALLTAFRYAREKQYQWVLTLDGDGQHDPKFIRSFLQAIKENRVDLIIGNRLDRSGTMPFHRILSNGITSIILSLCAGSNRIHDSQCGYRAIRINCIDNLKLNNKGFQLESELILKFGKAGYRLAEVPISTIYNNEKSAINPVGDTLKFIQLVIQSFFYQF